MKNLGFDWGIDEVGRGPLAGPVAICIFVDFKKVNLTDKVFENNLRDSKKLSSKKRQEICVILQEYKKQGFCDWQISQSSNVFIDKFGIQKATTKAIQKSFTKLTNKYSNFDNLFLDAGIIFPEKSFFKKVIQKPKADESFLSVACASILAKVFRDEFMKKVQTKLEKENSNFKEFDFDKNSGYGTLAHRISLQKFGLTKFHRKSFCKKLVF